MEFSKLEQKWQKYWASKKVFEPEIKKGKKTFYIQVAYPYPSGAMHIGHARTYTATDVAAKYKILTGFNVLMPMGWHVSGTPVIAAVEALQKGNEKTVKIFHENARIPLEDFKYLTKSPESFVDYMINKARYGYKAGFKKLGLGIDWRRELKTIDPQYKRFIEWQYKTLASKGYLVKKAYPVRYCPTCKNPVGDHDLSEGEGLGIQEFTLLKFKLDENVYLIAATLRPETVFGQTNLWVRPDIEYLKIKVGPEYWVASKEFFEKYKEQNRDIEKVGSVKGSELIGKEVFAPGIERKVLVLPAKFCDPATGTGIVTSVPSDAPIDYIALRDLQQDKSLAESFGLNYEALLSIKPIPIIDLEGYGNLAAVKICDDLGIKSQNDSEKLEEAKKIVYKLGFHKGVMNSNCSAYAGMQVNKAKEMVKNELLEKGQAANFYELEGKVVCRCGSQCVVRILEDQWFVKYSDEKWKEESKKTLQGMQIVPELFRANYEKVFDWLDDKPCTRSKGLGTNFPFQKELILEPLADSTIYMAYFTIAHLIKQVPPENLEPEVFDYIFLGKGKISDISRKYGIKKKLIEEMRESFNYWYPLAYNVSAIELIPNHMSFSIFQHTAIFPPNKRQKGTLNLGMVVLEGRKMSSSKGNVILINDMCDSIGADFVRFFLMNIVEPWEELNWQQREIEKSFSKLSSFVELILDNAAKAKKGRLKGLDLAERWFYNRINERINEYVEGMEKMEFRRALQCISFQLMKDFYWYEKRRSRHNKQLMHYFLSNWALCIAPFMPHIAEELWQKLGNKRSIFFAKIPKKLKTDPKINAAESIIVSVVDDLNEIKRLANIEKPKKIYIYVCSGWKQDLFVLLKGKLQMPDQNTAIKIAMSNDAIKAKGATAVNMAKKFAAKWNELRELTPVDEIKVLSAAKPFLAGLFGCDVIIQSEDKAEYDPKNKAKDSMPFKPAIYIE
ncbi:MAG: leucine--tRNA ligase [Candidatus Diapherotrites archaeon]